MGIITHSPLHVFRKRKHFFFFSFSFPASSCVLCPKLGLTSVYLSLYITLFSRSKYNDEVTNGIFLTYKLEKLKLSFCFQKEGKKKKEKYPKSSPFRLGIHLPFISYKPSSIQGNACSNAKYHFLFLFLAWCFLLCFASWRVAANGEYVFFLLLNYCICLLGSW